ncbi:MAG TPA: MMPL family transporter [Thermomicrobiales bacterium]|nr:MMPL family transporter [Thermomicrobiales bacterium]
MGQFSTAGMARLTSRHPWRTIIVWVVILAIAGWQASLIGDRTTSDFKFNTKPESVKGFDLIEEHMGGKQALTETVVVSSDTLTVDDPEFQNAVAATTTALRGMPDLVTNAVNYVELSQSADPNAQAQANALVSADRHATLIPVTLAVTELPSASNEEKYIKTVESNGTGSVRVLTVGAISSDHTFTKISEEDLIKGEGIGIAAALVVLLVVFGALVAIGLPLALALISIAIATGLASVIASVSTISFFVSNMISMIGLAVGIDYTLFIVERYREERRHGRPKQEAIEVAGGTASKAVLFSGLTVVFALLGLFMIPTTIFRSLGLGAVLVVVVAVLAMLTLIPVMLSLLGDRIDWPFHRHYDDPEHIAAQQMRDQQTLHGGFWGNITRVVMARPVISMVLSAGLLIALAIPYFDLTLGFSGISTLPKSNIRDGYEILAKDFQAGRLSPIKVVVEGQQGEVNQNISGFLASITNDPVLGSYEQPTWSSDGEMAVININLPTDPDSQVARDAVTRLRDSVVPQSFNGSSANVYVSGDPAFNYDFRSLISTWTPIVFAFVLLLSFILLTLAFRSIVVPIKAILMNLLGVGAAYGILVLVFEKGYLHNVLGFQQVPAIEPWLPIFLFCVLFGLSMDYHVFLLSRIREHYDQSHRNRESVAIGLQSTARIITGAALIMVSVFFGFAAGRLVMFQQMGFGLGMAVLIDATIIRSILVPSAMALLGDRNWYMPSWLKWLPDLRVEGAPRPAVPAPTPSPQPVGD